MASKTKYLIIIITILFAFHLYKSHKSEETKIPSYFLNDRESFIESVIALNKTRDLTQPPKNFKGVVFNLPENVETEALSLTERGINLSKQVSDEFLDYLHPELKVMYRDKLIKGSEMWLRGLSNETSGLEEQILGNMLIIEWINWFEKNGRSFENKLFK